MAKNEGMEKHEEFKAEFKKRVKEQAKMLYRKSLDEISDDISLYVLLMQ